MQEYQSVTVSVCMIVRDEEAVLERCLKNAAQFADEIIVVDTGSRDRTKRIAELYTDKLYDYVWQDDFAAARNASYEKASGDFILWLDADDDIEAEDIERLLELKRRMPADADVVFFTYTGDPRDDSAFAEGTVLRDRMVRSCLKPRWKYPIHEAIPIPREWKKLLRPDIRIFHRKLRANEPGRNLRIFEKQIPAGFVMNEFNLAYYCRELISSGRLEEGIDVYFSLLRGQTPGPVIYAMPFFILAMKTQKRYEELAEALESNLKLYEQNEVALCTLGDLMRGKGDAEKAEEYYRRALGLTADLNDLSVHFPAFRTWLPWIGICKLRLSQRRTEQAMEAVQKAAEFRPNNLNVMLLKLSVQKRIREERSQNMKELLEKLLKEGKRDALNSLEELTGAAKELGYSESEIEEALKDLDRFALEDDALAMVTGGSGDIDRNATYPQGMIQKEQETFPVLKPQPAPIEKLIKPINCSDFIKPITYSDFIVNNVTLEKESILNQSVSG